MLLSRDSGKSNACLVCVKKNNNNDEPRSKIIVTTTGYTKQLNESNNQIFRKQISLPNRFG